MDTRCYYYVPIKYLTWLQAPVKLTTARRFKLTSVGRFKLTTLGRSKLTTC